MTPQRMRDVADDLENLADYIASAFSDGPLPRLVPVLSGAATGLRQIADHLDEEEE